ncbi:MAG: hypothetical protein RRZ24_10255 [Clostridia bacterium]
MKQTFKQPRQTRLDIVGTLAAVTCFTDKGAPGVPLDHCVLMMDCGMTGDWHVGGERQISLLTQEARQWMETKSPAGLCFPKYRENLLIRGVPMAALVPGSVLRIGDAEVTVTTVQKHCDSDCPLLKQDRLPCMLAAGAAFARVTCSGMAHVGDAISLRVGDNR